MIPRANPFPNYPVAGLDAGEDDELRLTVRTPGILRAEELVTEYVRGFGEDMLPRGLNASVRGEFGSGKTHLLSYVAGYARGECRGRDLEPAVLSASAMEASPVDWYRAAVGPQLAALDLERLVFDLYVEAAKVVAGGAPLTAGAVAHIEEDPLEVRTLIRRDLLNATSVEREMLSMLDRALPEVAPEIRTALEGLLSESKPCIRWLEGRDLSERESSVTGLPRALDSDRLAADAIVAIAAVHSHLGRPFLLLVDELEHFVRFDEGSGRKADVTWLKRLLERLEGCAAATFVAGHSTAWEGHPDYLDRFTPEATVLLEPLSAEQVMEMVDRLSGDRGSFGPETGQAVADAAAGSIRGAISILYRLYEESEGFAGPLDAGAVAAAADAATDRRRDPEQALWRLSSMLASLGLLTAHDTEAAGAPFDLVAYADGNPAVVVEVRHALFGKQQQEQAQRFVDKLRLVNREAPSCLGVFVAEGSLDSGLSAIDASAARVFWFDLTSDRFVEEAREALAPVLEEEGEAPLAPQSAAGREDALTGVVDEIQAVKQTQAPAYEELEERLSQAAPQASELSFRPPAKDETHDLRRAIFEDLSKRPTAIQRLSLIPGSILLSALLLLVLGIGAIVQATTLAEAIATSPQDYNTLQVVFFLGGAVAIVVALYGLIRQFLLQDRFYAFKEERLRDIYVLERPLESLIDLNREFDQALDRRGPRYAMLEAADMISEERRRRRAKEGGRALD